MPDIFTCACTYMLAIKKFYTPSVWRRQTPSSSPQNILFDSFKLWILAFAVII